MKIFELDTPTVLIDTEKMDKNIELIDQFAKEQGIRWRPHIKTHKSVEIANRQIAKGATGITVAKLGEAEVMAEAGITDILVAYPISSPLKINRLLTLLDKASIIVAVDSLEQATILQRHLAAANKQLTVWIKVNCGLNRCGVEPVEEVVTLATYLSHTDNLQLKGIFTHAGQAYGAKSPDQIKEIAEKEALTVLESAKACEEVGIPILERSVGSTPTFLHSGTYPGITEIRPGNAVFYDNVQVGLKVASIDQCALTVLATVVSVKKNWLVLDTGSKALSLDQGAHGNSSVKGFGHIVGYPTLIIERLSEEHGVVPIDGKSPLQLGDVVQIIPNHACTVMNLADEVVFHQHNEVERVVAIDARGKGQ